MHQQPSRSEADHPGIALTDLNGNDEQSLVEGACERMYRLYTMAVIEDAAHSIEYRTVRDSRIECLE